MSKRCRGCQHVKELIEFRKEPRNRDGRQARCKECERTRGREYAAKWRRENPDIYRQKKRKHDALYYKRHSGKVKARVRAHEKANSERIREYNRSELRKETQKRSKAKRVGSIRTYDRRYRVEKRDELNAKARERYARDPSTATAIEQRRRARLVNAQGEGVTAEQWREILEVHDHRCAYCLARAGVLEMDHVISLLLGGEHSTENVVPACTSCNSSKKARTLLDCFTPHLVIAQRMTAPKIPAA